MIRPRHCARLLGLAGALCALFSPGLARAQVTITSTVTSAGPLFTYNYGVTNNALPDPNGFNDLAIVTFAATPGVGSVLNPTAPTGFLISFDSGNGLISFLEDNNAGGPTFAPQTTISGFSFQSLFGPGRTTFDVFDASGNEFTGPVTSAIGPAVVPEPGTWLALGMGAAGIGILAVRRKRASA